MQFGLGAQCETACREDLLLCDLEWPRLEDRRAAGWAQCPSLDLPKRRSFQTSILLLLLSRAAPGMSTGGLGPVQATDFHKRCKRAARALCDALLRPLCAQAHKWEGPELWQNSCRLCG